MNPYIQFKSTCELDKNINDDENEKTNSLFGRFNIYRIRNYYFNYSINILLLWWENEQDFTNLVIVAIYNDKLANIDVYYIFRYIIIILGSK